MADPEPQPFAPFPETHWSLVARAGGADAAARRQALAEVVRQYLPALRAHLSRRFGLTADRADDVLQSFLTRCVLERGLVARADRERGRFRNFLLASLERFARNLARRDRAARRRADAAGPLGEAAEFIAGPVRADEFETAWVRQVLRQAVERMRRECDAARRPEVWAVFEARVLGPALDGAEPLEYEALVLRFGLRSPREASNLLMTGKRAFTRALRSVIGSYEPDEARIDEEIRDLQRVLSGDRP